ncbi:MAG: hypothetical protein JO235_07610 [Chroococcidiopsidaceae cyanobacterium CP_BM_RX_35]|nr:hypothetical protein [Chroococcidiopsidaceae cyanobacterium CP_BM_RX_35]
MQLSNSVTFSKFISQKVEPSKRAQTQNIKGNRPKLSMIWIKETDGDRQRLVARWVMQD